MCLMSSFCLQKQARTYNCRRCVEEDCDVPVACELEDIHVEEDERTEMSCNVTFILPETYTVLWKFARKFRVTNLRFFKFKQQLDNDLDYVISPTQPRHRGTYFCEIQDYDGDTLVEKFFFVNVSRKDQYQSRYLKRLFKRIIAQTGTNQSVWGRETEKDEDDGFDIPGFFFSQKLLSTKALIFVTITIFVFVFLVTLACM
ncbi:hypothetical protein AB205_0173380 [Aquarana catesbeiana]|uniref:Ig-like domain-containing protein n=1 Tax=Aquarana catesbeiana TaxID=8400 RepID=A0A2G9QJJ5_AQUCT|nr:hypothetical protein AB205_0173380 [Aquarana catesbeiana]